MFTSARSPAAIAAFLGFFAGLPMADAAEPKVVVTIKPVHSLVAAVMAGVGAPHLVVDGAASPHTFTLKPSGAKAINDADVFFRVSETLEPFTRKVAAALPSRVKLVSLAEAGGMTLLDQRTGDTFEAHVHGAHDDGDHKHADKGHKDHDHDHDGKAHDHDDDDHDDDHHGKDSHIWLDPANAKIIVAEAAKVLSEKYPEHADVFAKNAADLTTKIDGLAAEIATELAPAKGKPFIVFHDAIQYFESRFGVTAAGSVTISPDVQPSAKRLTAVRKKVLALDAACVFAEPGFQPKLIAAVTDGTTARSGTIDPEGMALTPGADLYFSLMRTLAKNIKTCLLPSA
ncbi:MAG TPA: zinc ABC transporter substrate-binding protein [Hyphomicrobium sp.]|nr:zinc ABC transporter substrate-binding protein [Hyphomicrobium sp.]